MVKKLLKLSLGVLPGIIAYILYDLAFKFPDIVETVYSRTIYPVLTYFSYIYGLIPVSVSEILVYVLAVAAAVYIVFLSASFFKPQGKKLFFFFKRLICLLTALSTALFIFIFGWSMNYARNTLADSMGLEIVPSSTAELAKVCEKLAEDANNKRKAVLENENGVYKLKRNREDIFAGVQDVYDEHAPEFMNLGAKTKVKGIFTQNLLSSTQTTGIFSPFTYECHVNTDMPDLYTASTAAHEYAHFKGFAREDECNFISWYVTRNSTDPDFAYSGAALALVHAMNSLYRESKDEYRRIYGMIDDGIKRDWAFDSLYWDEFETEFAESSSKAYNNYLKSNRVDDGVKSYGRMLDLILALNREGLL